MYDDIIFKKHLFQGHVIPLTNIEKSLLIKNFRPPGHIDFYPRLGRTHLIGRLEQNRNAGIGKHKGLCSRFFPVYGRFRQHIMQYSPHPDGRVIDDQTDTGPQGIGHHRFHRVIAHLHICHANDLFH